MTRIALMFKSAESASAPVAGLPLTVRALLRLSADRDDALYQEVLLAVPGGALTDRWALEEIARLLPDLVFTLVDTRDRETLGSGAALFIAAETCLLGDDDHSDNRVGGNQPLSSSSPDEILAFHRAMAPCEPARLASSAGRLVLEGMGKPGDGIVSRHLNRPISIRISALVLRWRWFRPGHATFVTALTALAMLACLLAGTPGGLIAGAILFQAASVLDGVDGEVARATLRSSDRGAMLDSLTDAATNLGFLIGMTANLHSQGVEHALFTGLFAFVCLAAGMALLGVYAAATGKPVNFDAGKSFLQRKPAYWKTVLIWIFMRDFFAFAAMLLVIAGFGSALLGAFAVATAGWLVFVLFAVGRMARTHMNAMRPPMTR